MRFENYDYTIDKAEWNGDDHASVVISSTRAHIETGEKEAFFYTAHRGDDAPLNRALWETVMERPEKITDSEYTRIMTGQQPVPSGYVIRGSKLFCLADEKARAKQLIDGELDKLYSGRALWLSETNPAYAENRREVIGRLLALESDPDYPFVDIRRIVEGPESGATESGG